MSGRLHELLFHLLMLTLVLLLAWLSGRHAIQWDWTRHGGNSLGRRAYSAFWTWATALSALNCGPSWVTREMKTLTRARMAESLMK